MDWTDKTQRVSPHFTVEDCLWLHTWGKLASEADGLTDEIKTNLILTCNKMELVRDLIGTPIHVHSMYRPPAYSLLVGGSETDVHTKGMACDFEAVYALSCDQIKALLLTHLDILGLRMEDNGVGAGWVHIDTKIPLPGHVRFFKP